MKPGISMGGSVINIKTKKHYEITKTNANQKKNRAKVCIECKSNKSGYCLKYVKWCFKVNYKCLGIRNPYEERISIKKSKIKRKLNSRKYR